MSNEAIVRISMTEQKTAITTKWKTDTAACDADDCRTARHHREVGRKHVVQQDVLKPVLTFQV